MSRRLLRLPAALAALAFGSIVLAQGAPKPARAAAPDPLDAAAPVPAARHVSPLAGYRPAHEVPLGSWREANDTVTRIGGWRSYAREAAGAAPGAAPAPAAAPAAAAPGHRHGRGHHGHH